MRSTPKYELLLDRRLFIVRWREPSPEVIEAVGREITRRFAEVGEPLFYVALIGPDVGAPDMAIRDALLDVFERIYDKLLTTRLVIFGSGAKMTIVRTFTTALILVSGLQGRPMHVDKHFRKTAQVIADVLGYDPEAVIERVVAEGLLRRDELALH